jgi:hypothetical protein
MPGGMKGACGGWGASGISPAYGLYPGGFHGLKLLRYLFQEGGVQYAFEGFIAGNVELVYFIGLFEVALLKFNQVAVIPCKQGDLKLGVWYFSD